jgi:2-methylfumaryl-CoA isomerase
VSQVATDGPLAGLHVLEISSFVAAPLGGMTLAALGADVIRIDPLKGAPDRTRWPRSANGHSLYYAGLNKGKRSIAIDFGSGRGQQLIRDLLAGFAPRSGVVLTNADTRGWLSYSQLRMACPDLVQVEIQGRHDGSPAVDYTVNAEVGFPFATGPAEIAQPVNHVLPAWDIACGLYASLGVAAAARKREVSGQGERMRVALADVALAMAGHLGFLAEAQLNHVVRPRIGNHLYGGFARDFATADGSVVMLVVLTKRHWEQLLDVTGLADAVTCLESALGADFTEEGDRYDHREVLAGLFQRWFRQRPLPEVTRCLESARLLWSVYRSFADVVHDIERDPEAYVHLIGEIDQEGVGRHFAPGIPLISDMIEARPYPAPLLGAHTEEILALELGLSQVEISRLAEDGVVAALGRTDERSAKR